MNRKAQTFMPDYLASLTVLAVLVVIFLSSWNAVISNQAEFSQEKQARLQAERTTSFLVSTPGHPESWEENPSNVNIVGFASSDHVLQWEKLDAFGDLSYDRQRALLQTQNFYLVLENESGILEANGDVAEYGISHDGARTVVPMSRNVQVNVSGDMKTAKLNYVVWR